LNTFFRKSKKHWRMFPPPVVLVLIYFGLVVIGGLLLWRAAVSPV